MFLSSPSQKPTGADAGLGNAGQRFDEGRPHLDAGRWREAVRARRDVRDVVERELSIGEGSRVHEVMAARQSLDPSALGFLDAAWQGLAKLTNQASHERTGQPDELPISLAKARRPRLTAVLLSYISATP